MEPNNQQITKKTDNKKSDEDYMPHERFQIYITIFNKPFVALIDSSSAVSFIGDYIRNLAIARRVPIQRCYYPYVAMNGNQLLLHERFKLQFVWREVLINQYFYYIPNYSEKISLGIDFMLQCNGKMTILGHDIIPSPIGFPPLSEMPGSIYKKTEKSVSKLPSKEIPKDMHESDEISKEESQNSDLMKDEMTNKETSKKESEEVFNKPSTIESEEAFKKNAKILYHIPLVHIKDEPKSSNSELSESQNHEQDKELFLNKSNSDISRSSPFILPQDIKKEIDELFSLDDVSQSSSNLEQNNEISTTQKNNVSTKHYATKPWDLPINKNILLPSTSNTENSLNEEPSQIKRPITDYTSEELRQMNEPTEAPEVKRTKYDYTPEELIRHIWEYAKDWTPGRKGARRFKHERVRFSRLKNGDFIFSHKGWKRYIPSTGLPEWL